ncbi:MAG: hypothetical protein ABI720_12615 [Actinomycetes bacterium]
MTFVEQAVTMTCPDDVEDYSQHVAGSGAEVSLQDYERLALDMLAVEAGDYADVKDAMRKVIASAPDGADVAFLLSRALAHAGDRVLVPRGGEPGSAGLGGRSPSRWWVAAAVPFLGAAAMFWWLGAAGTGTMSMFVLSVGSLGAALLGIETVFLLRWQPPPHRGDHFQ